MLSAEKFDSKLKNEIYLTSNIYYIKIYSAFKIRVHNNPFDCLENENKIKALLERDSLKNQDDMTSNNLVNGNVASIIANFSQRIGIIYSYSDSTPKMAGYKKSEF